MTDPSSVAIPDVDAEDPETYETFSFNDSIGYEITEYTYPHTG
jgi:hypothetical protein